MPDEPLEATTPRLTAPDVSDFTGLRHALAAELAGTGAGDPDLLEDFRLAVDEMVSNAVRHGRPPVGLRLWTAADRIVCTISDGGPGWDDAFAGYGPAHGDDLSRGGMGLWLARQLCDHVDISRRARHPRGRRRAGAAHRQAALSRGRRLSRRGRPGRTASCDASRTAARSASCSCCRGPGACTSPKTTAPRSPLLCFGAA